VPRVRQVFELMMRPFRILGVSLAVAVAVYLGAAFLLQKSFSSYLTLYFPMNHSGGLGALSMIGGGTSADDGASISSLRGGLVSPLVGSGPQTATGILLSRTCLNEVVERCDLERRWRTTRQGAVKHLLQNVQVRTDKNGFLRVEVESQDPVLCVQILESMYGHLGRRASELTVNVSRRNRMFVEERLRESQGELVRAQQDLVATLEKTLVDEPNQFQTAYWNAKMRLEEAQARQASAKLLLTSIEDSLVRLVKQSQSQGDSLQALKGLASSREVEASGQVLASLATELQKRRIDLADAAEKFSKESGEYRESARNSGSIEKFSRQVVDGEYESILRGTAPQLRQAKAELAALEAEVDANRQAMQRFERAARRVPASYASGEMAKGRFATALTTRNMLQAELENARIAEARDPSRFEIVDPAEANPDPVGPRKGLLAALAFALALGVQLIPSLAGTRPMKQSFVD
jgi:hypothetical protein